MGNQFYKGRTNNHLTWVMVDATDFATPESNLSQITAIKIYGKLRGATGVNFVSSGAGSLTNDIQHVGPSATGQYTIALAKADLSDASAAWYDQYIITLSATGAAYQTLVVDGGIDLSAISAYQSRLSDLQSYLVAMSGMLSDTHSAAILGASNASEAQSHATLAASRILLVQSRLSDFNSVYTSDISDLRSYLSDIHSDLKSAIGGITVTLDASAISDIASAVAAATGSVTSDIYSLLSSLNSEFLSRVPKAVATNSQLSDLHSDLRSYLVVMSGVQSDIYSMVSNINSLAASSPTASDIASAVIVEFGGDMSDIRSAITVGGGLDASTMSDLRSAILSLSGMLSDTHSAATAAASRALLVQSSVSDVYSQLSDFRSDLNSLIVTTGVNLNTSVMSDLRSAITAGATGLDASALSDIASAVVAGIAATGVPLDASTMSDLRSSILSLSGIISDAHSAAAAGASRALLVQSRLSDLDSRLASDVSDIYSLLSDLHSDVGVMSGVVSDTYSMVTGMSGVLSDTYSAVIAPGASALSDIASAVWARVGTEPTTAVAANATMGATMDWLRAMHRNKITQTATVQSLRNDGDNADIASAAVSDDTTTFIRGEFGN